MWCFMNKRLYFISGLPRSGSTLLAAILRQNPQFHAGMTSPVGAMVEALLGSFSVGSEVAPMVSTEQRQRVLRAVFDGIYADLPLEKEVVFDTNRTWTGCLSTLVALFPDARVLCCVRNVAWVMDSLERRFRQNAFDHTRLFNTPAERSSVYTRVETLAQADRLVGASWCMLKEAMYGDHAARLLIIEYEHLVQQPAQVMDLIYHFLNERPFAHDFDDIHYEAPIIDSQLGIAGLHTVRGKVAPQSRRTILPPELFEKYSDRSFWRDAPGSAANVIAPASEVTASEAPASEVTASEAPASEATASEAGDRSPSET